MTIQNDPPSDDQVDPAEAARFEEALARADGGNPVRDSAFVAGEGYDPTYRMDRTPEELEKSAIETAAAVRAYDQANPMTESEMKAAALAREMEARAAEESGGRSK